MADKKFEISSVRSNPNSRIVISGTGLTGQDGRDGTVTGFIQNDINISGSNDFTNVLESGALEEAQRKTDALKIFSQSLGKDSSFRQKLSKVSFRLAEATIHSWTSSPRPNFDIAMIFVAIRATDNI